MVTRLLPTPYHYIRFTIVPPCIEALSLRKSIQDALRQSFGDVSAGTYVDVLWIADGGSEMIVRISQSEAARLLASVAAYTGSPRLTLLKESSFLPSLLSTTPISVT